MTALARRAAAIGGLALAGVLASGCKHDRSRAAAASYSTVTKPIPAVAAPISATGAASIPVEEEYEERSASAITAANLQAELVEVEKEMR